MKTKSAFRVSGILFLIFGGWFSLVTSAEMTHPNFDSTSKNDFSIGYRMGFLDKCSVSGLWKQGGECELLMGNESTPAFTWTGSGDTLKATMINPWLTSFDSENASVNEKLKAFEGQYVVIKYRQLRFKGPMSGYNTDYRVLDVYPVQQNAEPRECQAPKEAGGGNYSNGDRIGRIVKLSDRGNFNKSYELIFQSGNSGSRFKPMSVFNEELAKCLYYWMASGRLVKLSYNQTVVRDPSKRDTTYEVMRVEPVENLPESGLRR